MLKQIQFSQTQAIYGFAIILIINLHWLPVYSQAEFKMMMTITCFKNCLKIDIKHSMGLIVWLFHVEHYSEKGMCYNKMTPAISFINVTHSDAQS